MSRHVRLLALPLFLFSISASASDHGTLTTKTRAKLQEWYDGVGPPLARETFGAYVARTAFFQHGVGYDSVQTPAMPEKLRVELTRFECVTFIESSLAVARCGFRGEPTAACFEREVTASRYRGGALSGYASRLHYFDDWIDDNESRKRLDNLTPELGGEPLTRSYFHISSRILPRSDVSKEALAVLTRELAVTESRLSRVPHLVLSRDRAPRVLDRLEDGDLVAFVRERPGLLIHHAGFIYRVRGKPRLLHASSYHRRVVLTSDDVTSYLLRRPERRGVLVARPLSPLGARTQEKNNSGSSLRPCVFASLRSFPLMRYQVRPVLRKARSRLRDTSRR